MNDLAQSFVLNTHDPVGSITPEMIEAFERDGVVLLREALSAEWLMLSEMGLARVLADSGVKKQQFFVGEDGEFRRQFAISIMLLRLDGFCLIPP